MDDSPDSPVHHRTVRCTTGQSGAPPDSPVIYSRTTSSIPESSRFTVGQPGAPDTVRCTTGQSGVLGRAGVWLHTAKSFPLHFFFSWPCFYHLDKHISVQNNIPSLETYLILWFALFTHSSHKDSVNMCWASNHQNTYRNCPRAHFPFNLPLFGDLCQHIKKQQKKCNINAIEDQNCFCLRSDIFGSLFATTWFAFANQILFPISKSNTLV
jgi:hypothetical protein